jgi:pimeloyl-ACP methyl ester carboxylesterase
MTVRTEVQHHTIETDGVTHHYVTSGTGPPLVLIHGFPQTWEMWYPVVDRLAPSHRIIAPSLRGLGGSPGPLTGYDKHTLARDIHAVLRHECGDGPVVVCGHDLGSHVALAYALQYPSFVSSLVLVGPPPPGTAAADAQMIDPRTWHLSFHSHVDLAAMLIGGREHAYFEHFIRSRLENQAAISTEEIAGYAAAYAAPGALRSALEMYRALPTDRALNLAALSAGGRLGMQVTAVASADRSTRSSVEQVVQQLSTDGRVVMVEGSGHWIPQERPDVLADVLLALDR